MKRCGEKQFHWVLSKPLNLLKGSLGVMVIIILVSMQGLLRFCYIFLHLSAFVFFLACIQELDACLWIHFLLLNPKWINQFGAKVSIVSFLWTKIFWKTGKLPEEPYCLKFAWFFCIPIWATPFILINFYCFNKKIQNAKSCFSAKIMRARLKADSLEAAENLDGMIEQLKWGWDSWMESALINPTLPEDASNTSFVNIFLISN